MALPVLDGNQSATTLSSVVTGGEHIVAHSVVCFGSTAISNITNAVSGSVVSISNFPSTQTIAGTVTIGAVGGAVTIPVRLFAEREGTAPTGEDMLVVCNSGGRLLVDATASGASVVNYDGEAFVRVKMTNASSVTIGSLPAIFGAVTANVPALNIDTGFAGSTLFGVSGPDVNAVRTVIYSSANSEFGSDGGAPVDSSNPLPVSGTVAVNGAVTAASNLYAFAEDSFQRVGGYSIGSGQTARVSLEVNGPAGVGLPNVSGVPAVPVAGSVTIGSVPNGSLTTRFGTPTTANTAFATSAVTNANRKYLLIQNVTTGSNVITVGIGFTPTTTQGIQLTAGAGITFESSYIPTGAVQILSSVTASNFTILEA